MAKRMRGGEVKSVASLQVHTGDGPSTSLQQQIHVLAVDDSVVDRKLIEMLLKTSSYKVTTVDSAVSALQVLGIDVEGQSSAAASKFNMIITDYCMPKMTGYELLKKVKGTSFLREIPVVIMSSENVETRIKSCYKEGAEDFIIKPVKPDDVKRLSGHFRPKSGNTTPSSTPRKRKRSDSGTTTNNLQTDLIKCS